MNAHGHASVGKTLYFGALKASLSYTGATKGNARLKAQALPSKLLTVNDRRVLGGTRGWFNQTLLQI
jgi:hypothetical protein